MSQNNAVNRSTHSRGISNPSLSFVPGYGGRSSIDCSLRKRSMKPKTLFAIVSIFCSLNSTVFAQDDYTHSLDSAKEHFFAAETAYEGRINDLLDTLERKARAKGDRDAVLAVQTQRDAFAKSAVIPSGLSRGCA